MSLSSLRENLTKKFNGDSYESPHHLTPIFPQFCNKISSNIPFLLQTYSTTSYGLHYSSFFITATRSPLPLHLTSHPFIRRHNGKGLSWTGNFFPVPAKECIESMQPFIRFMNTKGIYITFLSVHDQSVLISFQSAIHILSLSSFIIIANVLFKVLCKMLQSVGQFKPDDERNSSDYMVSRFFLYPNQFYIFYLFCTEKFMFRELLFCRVGVVAVSGWNWKDPLGDLMTCGFNTILQPFLFIKISLLFESFGALISCFRSLPQVLPSYILWFFLNFVSQFLIM